MAHRSHLLRVPGSQEQLDATSRVRTLEELV